jgi:hypothetical protein
LGSLRAARLDTRLDRRVRRFPCRAILSAALLLWATLLGTDAAQAVEAINVHADAPAIDLTDAVDFQHTEGDRIQVSTAPGADAIIRRIEVRARAGGFRACQ